MSDGLCSRLTITTKDIYFYVINNILKLTILNATTLSFLATCFGRIAAIFRSTCTD